MAALTDGVAVPKGDFPPLKLRSYQTEMFEQSLTGNTIVVMETGSGKTLVAIHRIMHAFESIQDNKLIWFLTGGVALCRQQYMAVRRAIPDAVMKLIVGADGPELWGSEKIWNEVLHGVHIVFSTFAILHSALGHGYVRIESLALLIFDEAHHVTKDHPSNLIMKEFYHPQRSSKEEAHLPAILGLTASPAENGKPEKLSNLERNLAAVCKTPRKHRLELRQYVHRPSLERLEYIPTGKNVFPWIATSQPVCASRGAPNSLGEVFSKITKKSAHLAKELGCWAALKFLEDLEGLLHGKINQEAFGFTTASRNNKETIVTMLKPMIDELAKAHAVLAHAQHAPFHMSNKAQCFFRNLKLVARRRGKDLVAIVFVRQRVVAAMLEKLLASHADFEEIRSAVFVGESNSVSYEKELSELVVPRTQSDVLRAFRAGEKNLIVATDALDEGIDVAKCNTIICFDPPLNLRSFIQKRGRARKQESTYTIMAAQGCPQTSPEKFEDMEKLMSTMIQQEWRELKIAERQEAVEERVNYCLRSNHTEQATHEPSERPRKLTCVRAVLSSQTTRAHLEHFCAKLPRVAYTQNRPTFSCEQNAIGRIVATVKLPMSVPSNARIAVSYQPWATERAAIKDAAFQAYKGLYHCGLLNEHLLPIDNRPVFDEDFKRQERKFHHLGNRLCVWDPLVSYIEPSYLFRTPITIRNDVTERKAARLALWTKKDLSSLDDFPLFSESGRVLTVGIQASVKVAVGAEDISDILPRCTREMVEAARSRQLFASGSNMDFAVFITPDFPLDQLPLWLEQNSGSIPAEQYYDQRGADSDAHGLVVNVTNGNSLHVFREWELTEDDNGQPFLEINCSPFPKRRNFFKTTSSGSVSAEEEGAAADRATFIEARHCVVKTLPIEYSWAMRLVPSIFYRLELVFLGERLAQTVLSQVDFGNLSDLVCCIASSATMLASNYERHEFLGDSILKFHTTQQLYCDYPHWHEEHLTRKRNTIISNISLAKAAVAIGIDRFVLHEPFVGKNWSVPSNQSIAKHRNVERHLRMKILADVMEALIGAAFVAGGIKNARRCMSTLIPEVRENVQIAKLGPDISPIDDHVSSRLEQAQTVVGYRFRGQYLLSQALTHPSCIRAIDSEPYQRLEFLGDAVLDYFVVTELFTLLPHGSQSLMTKIKSSLVNANYLAYLCYSCYVPVKGVTYTATASEPAQRHLVQEHKGLWMMMRYEGEAVINASHSGFNRFEDLRKSVADALTLGKKYPWEELCMLHAPKFISDIIESVLGAIFVDSDGDLEPCRAFLEKIGLLPQLRRMVASGMNVNHPKEEFTRWLRGCKVQYDWKDKNVETNGLGLSLLVDGEEMASVYGCLSKGEAIIRATKAATKLFEDGYVIRSSI